VQHVDGWGTPFFFDDSDFEVRPDAAATLPGRGLDLPLPLAVRFTWVAQHVLLEQMLSMSTKLKASGSLNCLQLLHVSSSPQETTAAAIGTIRGDVDGSPDSPARGRAGFQGGWSVMGLHQWTWATAGLF
jgi:hypothetical protein